MTSVYIMGRRDDDDDVDDNEESTKIRDRSI